MGSLPLVTIVTPSLNQGQFIGETVESVLRQSYPAIEYVVLDAGSTDSTHEVLRTFGDRVRWTVAPDDGQADAINRGWRAGRGEVLAWLNADDLLEPGAVATAITELEARPDAAAVYGDAIEFHQDGREYKTELTAPFHLWRLINVFDYITQPSTFFRRDAVEAVGWLDKNLHYGMDWDLLIRLGLRYPLVYVPETMARVRIHAATKTTSGGRRRFRELVRIIRRYAADRRPPAYWFYGAKTYVDPLDGGAGLPPRRQGVAHRVIEAGRVRAYNFVAKRTFLAVDDWHPDGWVGPRTRFLVPPPGAVHLRGEVPADLAPQVVSLTSAGTTVYRGTLGPGPFAITFPVGDSYADWAVPLELTADRWKSMPHPMGSTRRGAFLLKSIERG